MRRLTIPRTKSLPALPARALLACALIAAAPLAGARLSAQTSVEVRGGVAVGSHSGSAAGLDMVPALSYEALLTHGIRSGVAVYAGYARIAFGCEEGFCLDRELTVVGSQAAVGVELSYGVPWLRLGVLYGTTEVGSTGGASDAGIGFRGAFGLTFGSGRVRFSPGASIARFAAGTATSPDHATALAADLGIRVRVR